MIATTWPEGHVSLASSVATSCKTSHSSGLSTADLRDIKVLFISCDEMIRGDRFSAGELNVVFEVRPRRNESLVEDRLAQSRPSEVPSRWLAHRAGGRLVRDSPPKEINQWKSERGCPAFDFLRPPGQVEHAETFAPTAPLRHHVNENIDVDENLQSVNLRAMISRIRHLIVLDGIFRMDPD